MIKTKDGYVKLIGTTYSGKEDYLLQANGGAWAVHAGRNEDPNKIVRTDASGYLLTGWINTTSGDMGTGTVTRIYCSNDGYIRYKTPANFFSTLANDENLISITIGSLNRKLTVDYASSASSAEYLNNYSSNNPNSCYEDTKVKWFAKINNSGGYAGNSYGFPVSNNANGILWLGMHSGNYGHLLGFSSNGYIYNRYISDGSFPTTTKGASWKRIAFITDNVASATTVKVSQHTTNNTNYPLVWSNLNNTSTNNSSLYKSYDHLYYNPSTRKLTSVGGINAGNSLLTTGTEDIYLEWWRKTNASWKILNTSGIFKFQCNYTSSVSSYYDVLTLSYNTGNAYLKGDFTLGGLILRDGESSLWVKGRDYAVIRMNTSSGYSPIWSAKTTNGSWDCGTYSGNILHFSYITDSNYNSSTNTQSADIYFNPNGLIGVNGIISTSTIRIKCTTSDYQEGLTIQNADSKWCTIRLGNTEDSGTTENTWSIHRTNNNNFSISRNSSNGANGLSINKTGNVGIGYADNAIPSGYRLSVNGTLRANDVFVDTGDATLKIYTGKTTDGKNDGNICFLTSIDATDGLSHAYPTLYLSRCNIVLLPRGGLVYIGTNPSTGDTSYNLYVKGNTYTTGYVSGNTLTSRVATGTAPLTVASTTKVANLNADTVDDFHASDFYEYGYVMFEYTIDASSLNQNTYYPVTFSIGSHYNVRIECRVSLNSRTKPSWSTHKNGFSTRKIWEVNGSGWGTNPINRRILVSDYAFASADPVRGVGLLTNSSVEYVYVRGGGKYYFYTSHNISPVLKTSTYTTNSLSVSPTTTAPAAITRNVAFITDKVSGASVADKLGTSTIGDSTTPIYLSSGTPKTCSVSTSGTADTIAVRDSVGDIACRLVRSTYDNQSTISGALAFRVNNSNDNYIRFCSDTAAIRTWLGVAASSHTHSYIVSKGAIAPQTGRTQNLGDVYSYRTTSGSSSTGAPTTYTSVIGFGQGIYGTVEIAGGWTGDMGLWYRALRDCCDNWYGWRKVLDSSNYASILDNRYYTESEADNRFATKSHTHNYAPSSHTHSYITTNYIGGQLTNPLIYFGNSIGVKVAMTGLSSKGTSYWSDTLWINGYSGADVPNMCALHFSRDGSPNMWISSLSNTSSSYGTLYKVWTEANFNPDNYRKLGGTWKATTCPGTREFGFVSNNGSGEISFSYDTVRNGVLNMSIDGDIFCNDAGYKVWHAGNMGHGSGLNADLLDGLDWGSFFLRRYYTISLTSYSTSNFYPLFFHSSDIELDCEIHSDNLGGGDPYNQNRLHFQITTQGWSDTGLSFHLLSRGNYEDNEVTIGAIGRGQRNGGICIWVRGGKTYRIYANREPIFKSSNYTYGDEVYTVGTNLWGGSNSYVDVVWKNDSTRNDAALALLGSNVASATKLQTARTIWGQSFDGTGNVNGNLTIDNSDIVGYGGARVLQNLSGNLGINPLYNVGIGTTSPAYKLDVNGDIRSNDAYLRSIGSNYASTLNGEFNIDRSNLWCNYNAYLTGYRYVIGWHDTGPGGWTTGYGIGSYRYDENNWGSMNFEVCQYESALSRKLQLELRGKDATVWTDGNIQATGLVQGSGFVKSGSSDSYVLLGGGGHKALDSIVSSFVLYAYYLINITPSGVSYSKINGNYNFISRASKDTKVVGRGLLYLNLPSGYSKSDVIITGNGHHKGFNWRNPCYLAILYDLGSITNNYIGVITADDDTANDDCFATIAFLLFK